MCHQGLPDAIFNGGSTGQNDLYLECSDVFPTTLAEATTTGQPETTTEIVTTEEITTPTTISPDAVCLTIEVSTEEVSPTAETVDSVKALVDYSDILHEFTFTGPLEFGQRYTKVSFQLVVQKLGFT